MKVLILHDTRNFAGTESHIMTLAHGLSSLDRIDLELLVPKGSELHKRCVVAGIGHHVSLSSFIFFFLKTFQLVWNTRPHVLHAHNGRTTTIAVLISKLVKCKVVATQHFIEPAHVSSSGFIGRLKRVVHQWVGKQLDFRICVSQAALRSMQQRDDMIAKTADQVRVIYSGINHRDSKDETRALYKAVLLSELHLPSNTQLILTAARLEREKSVDLFVKAIAPICRTFPSIHAVVAGDGSEAAKLSYLSQELGVSHQIHFLGFRRDVDKLLLGSDIFVLSSAVESFGMVLLEAMVSRTPVIAPNGGGPREIVFDRKSGLLYSPGDVGELTSAISELLVKSDLRVSLAECADIRAREVFSVSNMANETITAYMATLSGKFSG